MSKAGSEQGMKRLVEFYEHAFVDVELVIFGKKHTIKDFPWCMG